jgi:hypothetical protein
MNKENNVIILPLGKRYVELNKLQNELAAKDLELQAINYKLQFAIECLEFFIKTYPKTTTMHELSKKTLDHIQNQNN